MAVYFVTGKLGSGKTLLSVSKIRDYLLDGRPVATNVDLRLNFLLSKNNKNAVLYRLPDKPIAFDLQVIGRGNKTKDESKNGLIVLDECVTWFNSRTWADKDRQALIDYLVHIRKLGWDVIFLVQSYNVVDKQARELLGEHVVICKRTDRISFPLLSSLFKFFWGEPLTFPKVHLGIVRYGDRYNDPIVERWIYRARDLYSAYDTDQIFSDKQSYTYSVIPPFYTHGRYSKPLDFGRFMRLTKIYFKRHSKTRLLLMGLVLGFFSSTVFSTVFVQSSSVSENTTVQPQSSSKQQKDDSPTEVQLQSALSSESSKPSSILDYNFYNASISQYFDFSNGSSSEFTVVFYFKDEDSYLNLDDLYINGFKLIKKDFYNLVIKHPDGRFFTFSRL